MRVALLIATIVGFILTAGGLWAAYRGALTSLSDSDRKLARTDDLIEQWKAETAALPKGIGASDAGVNQKYAGIAEAEGIRLPTLGNMHMPPALHARDVLRDTVEGARTNLILAGIGLVISTAASAASLYVG